MRTKIWCASCLCAFVVAFASLAIAAECPMHDAHMAMEKRGDEAMGFDHTKTTHKFDLNDKGGIIRVQANDATDTISRDAIRKHLAEISTMFAKGDFSKPQFIHAQNPPGVPVMQKLGPEITYKYEDLERGAQVIVSSSNPAAVSAIHDFLKFQVRDHHTD